MTFWADDYHAFIKPLKSLLGMTIKEVPVSIIALEISELWKDLEPIMASDKGIYQYDFLPVKSYQCMFWPDLTYLLS